MGVDDRDRSNDWDQQRQKPGSMSEEAAAAGERAKGAAKNATGELIDDSEMEEEGEFENEEGRDRQKKNDAF